MMPQINVKNSRPIKQSITRLIQCTEVYKSINQLLYEMYFTCTKFSVPLLSSKHPQIRKCISHNYWSFSFIPLRCFARAFFLGRRTRIYISARRRNAVQPRNIHPAVLPQCLGDWLLDWRGCFHQSINLPDIRSSQLHYTSAKKM